MMPEVQAMATITRRALLASLGASVALPRIAPAAASTPGFATLAPRGSVYHRALEEVGEAWRRAAAAPSGFRIYPGGIDGDELDIVRRMRVGQLDGGMISVVGLSAIEPGAAALQYMPLVFRSWEEVDAVSRRLRPLLEQRIAERGFVVLYWGEAGWVRFFTKTAAVRPKDFQRLKIFSWSGTPQQVELMRSLGYQPVALETNDILPGLQTGLIDAVPTIASWALAAQIDHVAPHLLDMRWVPIVGAAVITRKTWDGMAPAVQQAVRQAAADAAETLRAERERADQAAIEAMRKRGLQVHELPGDALAEWQQLVAASYPRIRGGMVPPDMFDLVQQTLGDFRGGRKA
jgi:TRAP-type C4-dicarboxylate transport system substrate-binding protein